MRGAGAPIPESFATSIAATRSWTCSCCSSRLPAVCSPRPPPRLGLGHNGELPGGPVGGHQARNTDRRARGKTAQPSGHDPSAELRSGFAFQEKPALREARPHCPHPAGRHKPRPGRGGGPARPDPHRPRIFTQRDHPQMKWLRWSLSSLSQVEGWQHPLAVGPVNPGLLHRTGRSTGSAGRCRNRGPGRQSASQDSPYGISRIGGQAGTQAPDATPPFSQDQGSRARSTIHSLPAEYSRLALGLPWHGTCERMPQFCAAAQPS